MTRSAPAPAREVARVASPPVAGAGPPSDRNWGPIRWLAIATAILVLVAIGVVVETAHGHNSARPGRVADQRATSTSGARGSTFAPTSSSVSTITPAPASPLPTAVRPPTPAPSPFLPVVQGLATALANGNWAAVRTNPAYASADDASLTANYGGLYRATAVIVRAAPAGGTRHDVRLGIVGWENVGGVARSNVYCVTWTVDTATRKVVAYSGFSRLTPTSLAPEVRPSDERSLIRSGC